MVLIHEEFLKSFVFEIALDLVQMIRCLLSEVEWGLAMIGMNKILLFWIVIIGQV